MSSNRDQYRLSAALDRGSIPGINWCYCDYCKRIIAVDYHELIARSQTMGNKEARELSFQPELCSFLCRGCHEEADGVVISKALWAFNIALYGRERVETALSRLQDVMETRIYINE